MSEQNRPVDSGSEWDDEPADKPVRRWSAEEVRALGLRRQSLSAWVVVGWQLGVGLVVAALAGLIFRQLTMVSSALMGAGAIVVPSALMAWALRRSNTFMTPAGMAVRFMLWEFIKISISVLALWLAPKLVQPLNWPTLLVAVVLCLKASWLALLWRRSRLSARN